jgi:hypothetical protein
MNTKEMINSDLHKILSVLKDLSTNFDNIPVFTVYAETNINKVRERIDILKKVMEPSKQYTKYQEEKVELAKEYAVKIGDRIVLFEDEACTIPVNVDSVNGYPKIIPEKEEEFKDKLESLNKKYKGAIDDHEKKINKYNDLLFEKVDPAIKFNKLKIEWLPNMPREKQSLYIATLLPLIDIDND